MNSKHFKEREFRCRCNRHGPDNDTGKYMDLLLIEKLDKLRDMWGDKITVECGYRCPEHNAEKGGVSDSQHLYGLAADIWVGEQDVWDDKQFESFAELVLHSLLFDGVGIYYTSQFVHVDIRDGGKNPNGYLW